jgi:hypothetical protein
LSPWPPPLTVTDEDVAWARRARLQRRRVPYCELCERRYAELGPFILRPRLEVHHRCGRGIRSAVGWEDNDELMTLCRPCHARITFRHRRLGRQRGEINGRGRTVNPIGYSHTISEVTAAARPRYLARAFRRMLLGLPTQGVIIPRR